MEDEGRAWLRHWLWATMAASFPTWPVSPPNHAKGPAE